MTRLNALLFVGLLGVGAQRVAAQAPQDARPKRLLLVTTTSGFRHSSIEVGERIVRELAKRTGEFTVVSTSESPDSWSKEVGKGRVFYTSLGHRQDIWDPAWKDRDGSRRNSPEVSETFQKHLLDGIRWALRIDPAARKQ